MRRRRSSANSPRVVGDVHDREELAALLNNQPEAVTQEVRAYMQNAPFRSFISWQLLYKDDPIGVLNIQSSRPKLFVEGADQNDVINGYIRPFCFVLGLLVAASDSEADHTQREDPPNAG